MKAAVCYEFGKPLMVEELEIAQPKKGEVKVRLAATAICHSDLHALAGEGSAHVPFVAGHEAAGVVEEVGGSVSLTRAGDRVVVCLMRSCGRCFYCTLGSPHLCEGYFALNRESRLRNRRGQVVHHGLRTAAFAEYCIVDQSQVVRIPEEMPFDRASLLACGVITGVGAVINTAQVEPGSSVAVIGTGGVGLNAVQGAALAGAHPIIAIDLLDNKLKAAWGFGATHTINLSEQTKADEAVRALTSGRGADYVFVTVGSAAAVTQALSLTRKRGSLILVGMPAPGTTASFQISPLVRAEQRIMGSFMGSTRPSIGIPRLIDLYQHGRLKLDELITGRFPLERINEAIESVAKGQALRNLIEFDFGKENSDGRQ